MRIGINTSFLRKPATGIGQVTLHFLQKLVEKEGDADQEFFLYCEEEPKLDFPLPKNFHIRIFLPSWKRDDILRKILWERRVAYMAKKDHCDTFISLYQSSTLFPSFKIKTLGRMIRHIMIVHDIIPRLFPEYQHNLRQKIYWRRVERGIKGADHIIAVSKHTKNDLLQEYSFSEESISVSYPSVSPQFTEEVSLEKKKSVLEKYHLTEGYIYHGGGLEIRKNTEMLLRAYAVLRIKNKDKKNIPPLVISGKIFSTKNKLATDVQGLIKELKLQEAVRLLGFVPDEDLPAFYSGALFFVYPSLYEGFGLPVLEAMYMNVPVLSSRTSSLIEVGGTAVLSVDPKNQEELVVQMEKLLSDDTLRQALIAKGALQRVQFSWEQFVKNVLLCIKK